MSNTHDIAKAKIVVILVEQGKTFSEATEIAEEILKISEAAYKKSVDSHRKLG